MTEAEKRKAFIRNQLNRLGVNPTSDRLVTLEELYITAMCDKARVVTKELNKNNS